MLKNIFSYLGLVLILLSLGCARTDAQTKVQEFKNKYKESLAAWAVEKKACNNTYSYELSCSGGEGPSANLEVWIEQGKVVKTVLVITDFFENKELSRDSSLQLVFNDYPVCTIDEIYDFAQKEVFSADTQNNYVYFETDNRGLLRTAGTYPHNLMDACLFGYSISNLKTSPQKD